ncbi:MAG: hypothetical protein U5O16_02345 [Rhodococcus sp. (in: high G+C Gram-positive bacteria)]|nr:hypothetical protein [Rhodococcus sp. (in: high G+C Gram-positive bacteria)]
MHDLQTADPDFSMVTSVVRIGSHLVLGSISESALAVITFAQASKDMQQ